MSFKCNYCEKEPFEYKNFLKDHLALKHSLKFPCFQCNEGFKERKALVQHLSACHNIVQEMFPCEKCEKIFFDAVSHEKHMKYHNIEKRYKCKYCVLDEKTFDYKSLLKNHLEKFHGRNFLCHKCEESFMDQKSLCEHLSTFCNNQSRDGDIRKNREVFPCTKCNKVLLSPINYKAHLKIHDKAKKSYPCHQCHKIFQNKKSLKNHVPVCGYSFKCHLCDKTFEYMSSLKNHNNRIHQFEKHEIICDECDKTFVSLKEAQTHKNYAHNPNFAFKCTRCEKAFSGEANLKLYVSKKHKDCHVCLKEFPTIYDVRDHFKKEHPELCLDPIFPFAFDSDNFLPIKKEIKEECKEEIQDESSFCKNIKIEDQTLEIEKLRQSYEMLKKDHGKSLADNLSLMSENLNLKSEIVSLKSENGSLESRNQYLELELSTVKEQLMTMKQNYI